MLLPTITSITLEDIQYGLSEVYHCAQLFTAIAGLVAIVLPILKSFAIYHQCMDALTGVLEVMGHHLQSSWSSSSSGLFGLYNNKNNNKNNKNKNDGETICLRSDNNTIWVAGLVNTKNSCFLNVVLQALSSLVTLHTYLNDHHHSLVLPPYEEEQQEEEDQGPITGSLWKTIRQLSKPLKRHASFRPRDMVASLLSKRVILNREQQDAQELFQLIVGALDAEASLTRKKRYATLLGTGGGLKFFTTPTFLQKQQTDHHSLPPSLMMNTTPFTGLLASRLSCIQCGYTEAVRHFSFNNIQLIVPRAHTTTLDACLRQFTSIEYLQDATCRRCSLIHTLRSLKEQFQQLGSKNKPNRKNKIKKRIQEIESRIQTNRIEEDIIMPGGGGEGMIQRVVESPLSTKQVMFAKPPKILCLHLSRSAFHASGAVYKNTCHILFPEYLDLAPYTTNGNLCTQPKLPISSPQESSENGTRQQQQQQQQQQQPLDNKENEKIISQLPWGTRKRKTTNNNNNKTRYRLMSSIVHYGSHSYGHFVAFKRRILPKKCMCPNCCDDKGRPESWEDSQDQAWYRISDTKVDLCSFDMVQQSNPYMLLYELIDDDPITGKDEYQEGKEREDVEDLMVAVTTTTTPRTNNDSNDEEDMNTDESPQLTSHYTYPHPITTTSSSQQDADEALRIANSLLMNDFNTHHHPSSSPSSSSSSRWSEEDTNPIDTSLISIA
ncbi:hypothetical protein BDA99DRAFT_523041 [Phascolomyces articulosus]|uniref:ubiquitinyl hydrolase 1 n=1 Tax=Phascolomyces articulosus TaxID=60185 RepID=A0AAD5JQQ7_9FUNG|nr:hypothetical protein BDA99DRAFT_523041 [Phascolomyces articulosus]